MSKKRKSSKKKSQRGGDFLGDLNKGFKQADKFLKKTQVISKGLNAVADPAGKALALIPHPAAQVGSLVAPSALKFGSNVVSSLGYGKGRGRGRMSVQRRLTNL